MPAVADPDGDVSYQALFERRWGHLTRPHVRALAWLLDAPDLLDAAAPYWHGRIATLGPASAATAAWLAALERDPAPLDAALGGRFHSRLGLYAEKLMALYFAQQGTLATHGLQVRVAQRSGQQTIGEFDFLLREPEGVRHIEFASKFYLLDGDVADDHDLLVGPNLGDTLGRKMRKIFEQQLALAWHPAAQPVLQAAIGQPVDRAQALVKGWLFHPPGPAAALAGIAADHCRGTWRTLSAFRQQPATDTGEQRFVVLPRLLWLAPLKAAALPDSTPAHTVPAVPAAQARHALADGLARKFAQDPAPVMVAAVRQEGPWLLEVERMFVVPDDWPARAALRRAGGIRPA